MHPVATLVVALVETFGLALAVVALWLIHGQLARAADAAEESNRQRELWIELDNPGWRRSLAETKEFTP